MWTTFALCAAANIAWDATGIYPDFYQGPKTTRGINCWVMGDTAENLAKTPSGRALVHASRANRFVIWGLPWEALVEFSKAEADQPGQWQAVADELSERLHHPERPDPGARKSAGALPRP